LEKPRKSKISAFAEPEKVNRTATKNKLFNVLPRGMMWCEIELRSY
jgi:hypothetical protein